MLGCLLKIVLVGRWTSWYVGLVGVGRYGRFGGGGGTITPVACGCWLREKGWAPVFASL